MKYLTSLVILVLAVTPVTAGAGDLSADTGRMADQLAEADSNHDGMVTRPELMAWRSQQFTRFDRNGDGVLSDDDMPRLAQARQRLDQVRATFDVNGDRKVSRAEFSDGPTPLFDRIDTDHNGVVDGQELAQAKKASR